MNPHASATETSLTISNANLEAVLLPRLRGRVFHVTSGGAYAAIRNCGQASPNVDGAFERTYPQSATSYFTGHNCLCVFDLRNADETRVRRTLENFNFLRPRYDWTEIVFLFLGPKAIGRLISYQEAVAAGANAAIIIPEVEAGHPGGLSIGEIEDVLRVTISSAS